MKKLFVINFIYTKLIKRCDRKKRKAERWSDTTAGEAKRGVRNKSAGAAKIGLQFKKYISTHCKNLVDGLDAKIWWDASRVQWTKHNWTISLPATSWVKAFHKALSTVPQASGQTNTTPNLFFKTLLYYCFETDGNQFFIQLKSKAVQEWRMTRYMQV